MRTGVRNLSRHWYSVYLGLILPVQSGRQETCVRSHKHVRMLPICCSLGMPLCESKAFFTASKLA